MSWSLLAERRDGWPLMMRMFRPLGARPIRLTTAVMIGADGAVREPDAMYVVSGGDKLCRSVLFQFALTGQGSWPVR